MSSDLLTERSVAFPTNAVTGLDRPVPFGPWPEVGGGQVWTQRAFPCFSDFVVFLGGGKWVLVGNPMRSPGNIAIQWCGPPWEQYFTTEELQDFFHEHHYQYEGQCYDLINERNWKARQEGVAF